MTEPNQLPTAPRKTTLAGAQQPHIELNADNPITAMLQAIIATDMTPATADVAEKLTQLYERMEDRNAKRAFEIAMGELQAEMPEVVANKYIPEKNDANKARSRFADFKYLWRCVHPTIKKHGFTVTFTTRVEAVPNSQKERICAVCIVTHVQGHTRTNDYAVRISAPPGCTDAQADGSTASYAKRGALCDAFNIIVDKDNDGQDARDERGYITPEQAADFQRRVAAINANVVGFLRFAGAESFAKIREGKLVEIEEALAGHEQRFAEKAKEVTTPTTPPQSTPAPQRGPRPLWNEWIAAQYAEWEVAGQDGKRFAEVVNIFVLGKAMKGKEDNLTEADRQALKIKLAESAKK